MVDSVLRYGNIIPAMELRTRTEGSRMSSHGSGRWALVSGGLAAVLASACCLGPLVLVNRRVYRPVEQCRPGEVCAVPAVRRGYRIVFWVVVVLVAIALGFPYAAPLFY